MNFQMTEAQAVFLAVISQLPSSANTPWNTATEQMYLIGLRNIPDTGLPTLCEAVLDQCKFRPTVQEIKSLWRTLTAPQTTQTAAEIVASLSGWVRRFGAYAMPHPSAPNTFLLGPPPDLTPQEKAVVDSWGSWEAYANDQSNEGVKRGLVIKIANMVVNGGMDEEINRLRLEYREMQAALGTTLRRSDQTDEFAPLFSLSGS